MSSIEATLALAIKNYRVIVDSRRFIPLAGEGEFKSVFDLVFSGLLENFDEIFVFETEDCVKVNCKLISLGTDILKLLITLKYFINQPVYADEVLHKVFERAAHLKDLKIISESSDFDDHKAKKRFETFLVNIYVLLFEDSSLNENLKKFLNSLSSSRLQAVLFEAAPRASQEEIYRKSYRNLLLNISSINETIPQIIKRLDSYFPEPEIVEGLNRKNFILERLGWNHSTVYQCAEKLNKKVLENCVKNEVDEAIKNFEYFWILLVECKFVAVDECCATLFIFPSECETFHKTCLNLSNCFTEITKITNNFITEEQTKVLNEINREISIWIKKLVKAVGSNYIHFERDINNRNYQNTNKQLYKIVVVLTNFSKGLYDHLKKDSKGIEICKPASDLKIVADFIEKPEKFSTASEECLADSASIDSVIDHKPVNNEVDNATATADNDVDNANVIDNVIHIENHSETETKDITNTNASVTIDIPASTNNLTAEEPDRVPVWAIAIAVFSTIVAAICVKSIFFNSDKS